MYRSMIKHKVELWILAKKGKKACRSQRESRMSQEDPQNKLTWIHHRTSLRLNQQLGCNLYGSNLGPLHLCYDWVAWCSCGNLNSGSGGVASFAACGILSPLLGCLVQPWYDGICLVLLQLVMLCLLMSVKVYSSSLWRGEREGEGVWGSDLNIIHERRIRK